MRPFDCLERAVDPPPVEADAPPKWREVQYYKPAPDLVMALQIAMAMSQPLLLTGEPGCGKTSAAYWAAWKLGLHHRDLFHVQVRSDSTAARLKYEFDAVRYFRESQSAALKHEDFDEDHGRFIQKGPLWAAFDASSTRPVALLLDEIDKAPRDFPNDLLQEFDTLEFEVPDWPQDGRPRVIRGRQGAGGGLAAIVFTSNGERQLPDAFLRRCIHHHLRFDEQQLAEVVHHRMARGDLQIAPGLVEHAIQRFVMLQNTPGLRHRPGLSEFLVWLRVVALVGDLKPDDLARLRIGELPYLGALLKDPADHDLVVRQSK
jgi:MoxR-like ATPase